MCGIAFIQRAPGSDLDVRLTTRMLVHHLASRGRDAAGVAWKRGDGITLYRKFEGHPVKLAGYLSKKSGSRSLDHSEAIIIHTRFGTVGDPADTENNHPIIRPGVAMVHNGSIKNTAELYRLAGAARSAAVDSDALAALIETAPDQSALHGRFKAVRGLASLAWLEVTDDPDDASTVHAARLDTRPLIVGRTNRGDIIGASTMEALVDVAEKAGFHLKSLHELPEGAVITARDGDIVYAKNIGTGSGATESTAEYAAPSKVSKPKTKRAPNQNEKAHRPRRMTSSGVDTLEPMW